MSKIAFLFPGQGAQSVGMGKDFVPGNPAAEALFAQAEKTLGYDLLKLCYEGPVEKLDSTEFSQPALFVSSLAALEVLKTKSPDVVASCASCAGLSLGEYTALVFAGVLDFETGLKVVQERGRAMQAAANLVPSGMVSLLGLELPVIEKLCNESRGPNDVMQVANHLCPGNIVVSGHKEACVRVAAAAEKAGAMKTIPLAVAGAFHTPLMQTAVDRLAAILASAKLSAPRIPVISNVDAVAHSDPEEIRDLLVKQVCSPVRWEDSMRALLAQGHDLFYEVGPGRVLRGLMKRIDRKTACEGAVG